MRHQLSNLDEANKKATCAICGPVAIQTRNAQSQNKSRWRCPTPSRRRRRRYDLRIQFNISDDDYQRKLENQNGRCAVCGSLPDPARRLAVDHNHETGVVRDLLCHTCNWIVGVIEATPERGTGAIEYLNRHNAQGTTPCDVIPCDVAKLN